MKKQSDPIKYGLLALGLSLLIGWVLNLVVGFSYSGWLLIPSDIVTINALALGTAILVSLYFTRTLMKRIDRVFPLLALSAGLLLGTGIITFIAFFVSRPASFLYTDNRLVSYLSISLLFFIVLNAMVTGFVIFQHRILEKEKALNEEKTLKTQMELSLLTSKINPHFLFNSLNLMVSLLKDPRQAETAIINLSEILRYQIDFSDMQAVSLATELNVVEKYLALQKMRFGDRLTYQITGEAQGRIPPMILQPLVENSIKHNMDTAEHLHIELNVHQNKDAVFITVLDSEARLDPEMLNRGVGLTATRKRIMHFGGRFVIQNGGIEISFKP